MANPQRENGHIDIANEIAEKLAEFRIPGELYQVLWVLWRKTYGWHKKRDSIPLSQFVQATKMKKPSIIRSLTKLLKHNIISKSANGEYSFQKNYDEWTPFGKNIVSRSATTQQGVAKVLTGGSISANGVSKSANESLAEVLPSKETTKETISKEKTAKKGPGSAGSISFGPKKPKPEKSKAVSNKGNSALMQEIADYWNKKAPCPTNPRLDLVKVIAVTETRKINLRARIQEKTFIENWKKAIDKISLSPFCRGATERGWRASFDWFIKNDNNCVKALEGKYDDIPEDDPLAEQKMAKMREEEQIKAEEDRYQQRQIELAKLPLEEQQKIKKEEKDAEERWKFVSTLGYNLRLVQKETSQKDGVFWKGFLSTLSNPANSGIPVPVLYKKYQDAVGRGPEVDIVSQILSDYDRKFAEAEKVFEENYAGAKQR